MVLVFSSAGATYTMEGIPLLSLPPIFISVEKRIQLYRFLIGLLQRLTFDDSLLVLFSLSYVIIVARTLLEWRERKKIRLLESCYDETIWGTSAEKSLLAKNV